MSLQFKGRINPFAVQAEMQHRMDSRMSKRGSSGDLGIDAALGRRQSAPVRQVPLKACLSTSRVAEHTQRKRQSVLLAIRPQQHAS